MIKYVQGYIKDRKGTDVKIKIWGNRDLNHLHFNQFEYLNHMTQLSDAYIIAKAYYERG